MPSLKQIIEQSDSMEGRVFDFVVLALIIFSLVTFSIQTLPNLSDSQKAFLRVSEIVVVALFTAEYLGRVFVADRRWRFVFSFYGIIDALAILPFYIAGIDLRSIRAFRLFRLIRILKLLRYGQAIQRFRAALQIAKEELVLFGLVTLILLWLSAVGIYHFENQAQPEQFASVFHSLWWAVATLTTVGYGDVYPITVGGKLFTFVVLMLGLGVVAVPAGLVASSLAKARSDSNGETGEPSVREHDQT